MTVDYPGADLHTLTGAYVLHALSDEERVAFERHLTECPACAQEVTELAETSARLGVAVDTPPPPLLRSRVMAEISQTRQLPPLGDTTGRPVTVLRPRRWPMWTALTAAAASVVLAVTIAIGTIQTNRELSDELAALQASNAELGELLAAPDAEVGTAPASTGGTGILVVSRDQDRAMFMADGLPALPADRTYQLWLVGDEVRSGGLLDPAGGPLVAQDVGDLDAVAITVEPAGGSPSGTTDPILELPVPG